MATYSRSTRTVRTVEYEIPTEPYGACWVEFYKVVNAIHRELEVAGRINTGEEASDDLIRIKPSDNSIIVYYEAEVT